MVVQLVFVYAYNDVIAAIDTGLFARGRLLDAQLGHAGFDGFGHAPRFLNLFYQFPGFVRHILGEAFHHVGAAPRVHHVGDTGLFLNNQLGIAGNARCKLCR